MGLFSSSTQPKPSLPIVIEQRSHDSINLGSSSANDTLHQLNREDPVKVESVAKDEVKTSLDQFTNQFPNNMFVIDGDRDTNSSIICTDTSDGKSCLNLQVNLVSLFKIMQNLNYFCSVADDVESTYFECRKMP